MTCGKLKVIGRSGSVSRLMGQFHVLFRLLITPVELYVVDYLHNPLFCHAYVSLFMNAAQKFKIA